MGEPAAAVEIEPHLALQAQAVAFVRSHATRTLFDRERGIGAECERRQIEPCVGHAVLTRVDRGGAVGDADAPGRIGGITPDFLRRPRRRRDAGGDTLERRTRARVERQRARARLHEHVQATLAVEARRPVAGQRGRHETGGQHGPQDFLARLAGHAQLDLRAQHRRHAVGQAAVHAQVETVGLGCGGRTAAERELVAVALQWRDALAVDIERDEAARLRHAQRLWPLAPGNVAADLVRAGRQPQCGTALIEHAGRLAIEHDLLRPVGGTARQRDPAVGVEPPALAEVGAVSAGRQRERAGPGTHEVAGAAAAASGQQRTAAEFLVLEHPATPGFERGRHHGLGVERAAGGKQGDNAGKAELGCAHVGILGWAGRL